MLQIWRLGDFVKRKGEYLLVHRGVLPCDLVMIPASISIIWHCVIIYIIFPPSLNNYNFDFTRFPASAFVDSFFPNDLGV